MNRLSSASEIIQDYSGWSRTHGYDQWGNRWVDLSSGIAHYDSREPTQQSDFDDSTNRLTVAVAAYDDAGNQTIFAPFTL
jgi:hypothetical protein